MIRRVLTIAGAVALFSATVSLADDEVTRAGEHFRVICHFSSEEIASAALQTAEAVWPVANELFGVTSPPPKTPLEIHVYRSAADYQAAEDGITGGRFRKNLAFSHQETKSAHVAIQPDCSDAALRSIGLNAQTRRLIAHEAAHVYRYATFTNYAYHPEWLATGAAAWIADEIMTRGRFAPVTERDPFAAADIVSAKRLAEQRRLPTLSAVLKNELGEVESDAGYGVRWLLFRSMQAGPHRDQWAKVLGKARQLGGGKDYPQRLYKAIQDLFGSDDLARWDEQFNRHIAGLQPQWDQVLRALEIRDTTWVQMAFPDTNALAWRTERAEKDAFRVGGSFQILPGGRQQLNLLLGRTDTGFISVAFVAEYGVTVFEHRRAGNQWERLGGVEVDGLELNRWIPFRVQIQEGRLDVRVLDRNVCTVPLHDRSMRGPWGVGTQAGSAGMWRDVKLEPQ